MEADHHLPIIDFDLSSLVASYCFFFNSSSKLLLWNTGLKTTAKKKSDLCFDFRESDLGFNLDSD